MENIVFDIYIYIPPRRYPYFDVVVGLCVVTIPRALLAVPYATGRVSHSRQVKGDDPDKKGYPGPTGWWFGVGLTTPHSKKLIIMMDGKGLRRWRELVTDRKKWKDIVRQAKAHSGL
jgi:hypothetical protein